MRDPISRWIGRTFALLVAIHLTLVAVPRSDGHLLSADAAYYYSYLRSAVMDGDLDVANDIALYNARLPDDHPGRLEPSYAFSIGPALLWLPFFLAGQALALAAPAAGIEMPSDGYAMVVEGAVCLAGVLYAGFGLLLLARVVERFFGERVARWATLGTFAASGAAYYTVFEPSMSHTLEFFSVAAFLHATFARRDLGAARAAALGAAAGLMCVVRWQNAVFLPLAALMTWMPEDDMRRPSPWAPAGRVLAGVLAFVPFAALQAAFWMATIGTIGVPQGEGFMRWSEPRLLEVLFSTCHGLVTWTPVTLVGLVGLALVKPARIAVIALACMVLDVYVCGVVVDWWGGDAFGMRRMTGALPLVTLGLGALLARARTERAQRGAAIGLAALALWNAAFMVQYRLGTIPRAEPLTFHQMVTEKFVLPVTLVERLRR